MKVLRSLHSLTQSACTALPHFRIAKQTEGFLLHPFYHTISHHPLPHVAHLYRSRTLNEFELDLDYFLSIAKPLSLQDLLAITKAGDPLPSKRFMLSFDDGLAECQDVIAPILRRKGIPATFFVLPLQIDSKKLLPRHKISLLIEALRENATASQIKEVSSLLSVESDNPRKIGKYLLSYSHALDSNQLSKLADILAVDFQEFLDKRAPYLSTTQILSLRDEGFAIGGHSMTHPHFSTLSLSEQLSEALMSVRKVRELCAVAYGAFAFPFSDRGVSAEFFESLRNGGEVDVTFGTKGVFSSINQFHFQRFPMEGSALSAQRILTGQYYLSRLKGWAVGT